MPTFHGPSSVRTTKLTLHSRNIRRTCKHHASRSKSHLTLGTKDVGNALQLEFKIQLEIYSKAKGHGALPRSATHWRTRVHARF